MKIAHAVLILILSIVIQASPVRLFDLFSFAPNLSLVALFLLCYFLSFEKLLILAIIAGIAIDLLSSVSFGSTSLAAMGACSLSFYLRKNVLKGGRIADFFLNSLITFFVFYFLLGQADIFLKSSTDYAAIFNLININLAGEILFNLALSAAAYYLAGYYKSGKIYGFTRNIKISP
ncbi:hypothetical protein KKB43_07115 [Patescibacteria group bacterium]|nr:hypothetical protein [Patescibacteria group bacterium]MBU4580745.1 hypothetical protein [Patescibacteria group bacterium]